MVLSEFLVLSIDLVVLNCGLVLFSSVWFWVGEFDAIGLCFVGLVILVAVGVVLCGVFLVGLRFGGFLPGLFRI